ncbi:hypothetical protein [Desulforegula conservatrix]|uniref:hypothetical protein n=1 Tax=Desulforegula conservatrix TaxID=153026 RepID=UPI0003F4EF00|nr:hypothetical protein [Desulforegula conservatrix]
MSSVTIEFWPLLSGIGLLLVSFLGFVFAAGKILLSQTDKRLDQRFVGLEAIRAETAKNWEDKFTTLMISFREEAKGWQNLEKDFLKYQNVISREYVRREDYIRNQTIIEAKLDGVAMRIENLQLKGLREC